MKRLLTTLVILTGLLGSGGAVWADAVDDYNKGVDAYNAGNEAEAVKWYRKAAEQGNAKAQVNLGVMYYEGKGVTQDYQEAVKWYRKAAEQGLAGAQYNLGNGYYNGIGVTQDFAEAEKWYRKAAEQGDADAQHALGWMYLNFNGEGFTQDLAETLKWWKKVWRKRDRAKRCMESDGRDCDAKAKSWWQRLTGWWMWAYAERKNNR